MDTPGPQTPKPKHSGMELPKTLITDSGASASKKYDLLEVGQVVSDRYKVLAVLGHGGMGAVYKVEQIFLRQQFALKTLHGVAFTDVAIRRFQKEAQAASKLQHPNLVRAHDFGVLESQQPFFVMDLVEGPNLSEYSRKTGILGVEEVLNIFIPVCFGLGYAHEQGVIHRDIKPGNIMLSKNHEAHGYMPKVVDFGIVKFTDNEEGNSVTLTRTGEVFGTPLYMSPEQCSGIKVDQRSDIYSLGCVMYEVLTGAPPFHGDSALNLMIKHQTTMPSSLKEASMGRDFSNKLEAIIAKTLIKDPNLRYQNVLDLARDLATYKQELAQTSNSRIVSKPHSQTVKDIPVLITQPTQAKTRTFKFPPAVAYSGLLIAGVAIGVLAASLFIPKTVAPATLTQAERDALVDGIKAKYEEALTVGNQRYLTVEGSATNMVQIFKFPKSFDIGVFKFTNAETRGDNSAPAQGPISVPLQAETFLNVPASKLYSYPHLLKGFQSNDLHHLQIISDNGQHYEDLAFVYDESLATCTHLYGLKELFLFGTKATDRGVSFVKDLPGLISIDFSQTKITPGAVKTLKNFPNMHYIGLKDVDGAKSLIDPLLSSKTLSMLDLSGNDLDNSDLLKLSKIPTLIILSVDTNPKITDEGLKPFKNLVALNIASTGVTPAVRDTIKKMSKLRVLTISKDNWPPQEIQKLVDSMPDLTVQTKKLNSNNRLVDWNWRADLQSVE